MTDAAKTQLTGETWEKWERLFFVDWVIWKHREGSA